MGGLNPYVFIVGCPRSGTTLLRRMVDAHRELAITRETHWIPEIARAGVVDAGGRVGRELVLTLYAHRSFRTLELELEEVERCAVDGGDYASFVSALFDLYGAHRGKRHVGDKVPGYVHEISWLHDRWPLARFVHLVRDGRDVTLSAVGWERKAEYFARRFRTWGDEPLVTAALWWRWHVLAGRAQGVELPIDRYLELGYEALVADPNDACHRLCAFLGLEWDDRMLAFHEGRTRDEPGLSSKRAWLPPTPGLRDWRQELSASELALVEAAIADILPAFGYEPHLDVVPEQARERVTAVRDRLRPDLAARAPVPEGW